MISIMLVDDHPLVLSGIAALLSKVPDLKVIAEASSAEEALEILESHNPQIILMDFKMPGMGGLAAIPQIVLCRPEAKVIVLTTYIQEPLASSVLKAGAKGYVSKNTSFETLLKAIRQVHAGKRYLDPTLENPDSKPIPLDKLSERLSPRELEILSMIGQGLSTQSIAEKFGVSSKTINTHRYRLHEKLGLKNDVELVHFAIRYKLAP